MKRVLLLISILVFSFVAEAKVLQGLIDRSGNPVHSADEFTLYISTTVTPDSQGYRYTYTLSNDVLSNQSVWSFRFFFQDSNAIVLGTASTPWGVPTYPRAGTTSRAFSSYFGSDPDLLNPQPLHPNSTLSGYTFLSPYPPGIIKVYVEGVSNYPWYDSAPLNPDAYELYTPYGPGKVMPAIGPVKPAVPNVTDNYSVVGCVVGICDVQLDITGPMDPYGTAYNYQWSGAFGTATGAKPLVQLAAGTYNVSVSVSDPYATLVTATMPMTVVDPNPAAIITPAQAAALTPAQLANLTPAQVASVIAALSPTQVAMLTPLQISALTPTQVAVSLAALSPAQIAALSPAQLGGLTPAQIGVITPQLTPAQLAALPQLQGGDQGDMDHDGIADDQDDDRDGDGKPNNEGLDPDHPD